MANFPQPRYRVPLCHSSGSNVMKYKASYSPCDFACTIVFTALIVIAHIYTDPPEDIYEKMNQAMLFFTLRGLWLLNLLAELSEIAEDIHERSCRSQTC